MPMIDVYAATGTFADPHALATAAAATVMRVEAVPEIPMFRENTARVRPRAARGGHLGRHGRLEPRPGPGPDERRARWIATSSSRSSNS
jgi:hypothetical protein